MKKKYEYEEAMKYLKDLYAFAVSKLVGIDLNKVKVVSKLIEGGECKKWGVMQDFSSEDIAVYLLIANFLNSENFWYEKIGNRYIFYFKPKNRVEKEEFDKEVKTYYKLSLTYLRSLIKLHLYFLNHQFISKAQLEEIIEREGEKVEKLFE